jgi:Spy/CpxP family protein refolding chaperone
MGTEKKKLKQHVPSVLTPEQRLARLEAKLARAEHYVQALAEQAKRLAEKR